MRLRNSERKNYNRARKMEFTWFHPTFSTVSPVAFQHRDEKKTPRSVLDLPKQKHELRRLRRNTLESSGREGETRYPSGRSEAAGVSSFKT